MLKRLNVFESQKNHALIQIYDTFLKNFLEILQKKRIAINFHQSIEG